MRGLEMSRARQSAEVALGCVKNKTSDLFAWRKIPRETQSEMQENRAKRQRLPDAMNRAVERGSRKRARWLAELTEKCVAGTVNDDLTFWQRRLSGWTNNEADRVH